MANMAREWQVSSSKLQRGLELAATLITFVPRRNLLGAAHNIFAGDTPDSRCSLKLATCRSLGCYNGPSIAEPIA
jgi:hypothetical protein